MKEFKNQKDVAEWLNGKGWKISTATLNRHIKVGKLSRGIGGVFHEKDVNRYAVNHLKDKNTHKKETDQAKQNKKIDQDLALGEIRLRKERLQLSIFEGKHILKTDADREFSNAFSILYTNHKGVIIRRASEWIDMVGGDHSKEVDFVQDMFAEWDKLFNEVAQPRDWKVLYESEEGQMNSEGFEGTFVEPAENTEVNDAN